MFMTDYPLAEVTSLGVGGPAISFEAKKCHGSRPAQSYARENNLP